MSALLFWLLWAVAPVQDTPAQDPVPSPVEEEQAPVEEAAPAETAQDPEAPAEGTSGEDATEDASQDASEPERPEEAAVAQAAAPLVERLAFDRTFSAEEVDAALEALAAASDGAAVLETLATLEDGHALRGLRIRRGGPSAEAGETEEPDGAATITRDARPLLLFAARGDARHDAEAVLAFGDLLVHDAESEPALTLLARYEVLLVPLLDPTARAEDRPDTRLDLNFPLGWQPAALRPGSGDVPLSEPASRSAAELLGTAPHLALVVSVVDRIDTAGRAREAWREEPWPGAEFPASDRAVLRRLVEEHTEPNGLSLWPWNGLGSPGGGFLDYAYQAFGVYPLAWESAGATEPAALARWARSVAERTGALALSLPVIELRQEGLTELSSGLWRLDVSLRNRGALPTLSALGADRLADGDLKLRVDGARIVATARKSTSSEAFGDAALHGAESDVDLACGILGGGETRWLRLVLEGERGSELTLSSDAARAGSARLTVRLTDS